MGQIVPRLWQFWLFFPALSYVFRQYRSLLNLNDTAEMLFYSLRSAWILHLCLRPTVKDSSGNGISGDKKVCRRSRFFWWGDVL